MYSSVQTEHGILVHDRSMYVYVCFVWVKIYLQLTLRFPFFFFFLDLSSKYYIYMAVRICTIARIIS